MDQPFPPPRQIDAQTEEAITDLFEQVIDVALVRHTEPKEDGETFIECRVCGRWEDHDKTCPIAAIQNWLEEGKK